VFVCVWGGGEKKTGVYAWYTTVSLGKARRDGCRYVYADMAGQEEVEPGELAHELLGGGELAHQLVGGGEE